ncbi:MAG: hypothetical protein AB1816_07580 [Bacillota bacterium]
MAVFSVGLPWALFLPVVVTAVVRSVGKPEGPWRFVAVGVAAVLGLAVDVWAGRWAMRRCA